MRKRNKEQNHFKKTTFADQVTITDPAEIKRKKKSSKTIKLARANTLQIKFNIALKNTNIEEDSLLENKNTLNSESLSSNRIYKKNLTTRNPKTQFSIINRKYSLNNQIIPKIFNLNAEKSEKSQRKSIFAPLVEKRYWDHNRKIYDPLEVPPEDEIFNHHLLKPKKENIKKDEKENSKKKNNNNNNSKVIKNYQSVTDKILGKIYNVNPVTERKVLYLKKKKDNFSLGNYQKLLLRTCENRLSKDNFKKLDGAFNKLRLSSRLKLDTDYRFIKDIEEEEEKIIRQINYSGNAYMNLIAKSNEFNITVGNFKNKVLNLPKIKFKKVMKKKKYQKFLE